MYVRPAPDPVWDPKAKTHVLSNVLTDGAIGQKERPPGYRITGQLVTQWGHQWLQTKAGNLYRLDHLTTTNPES